jgi:hypothetical protein
MAKKKKTDGEVCLVLRIARTYNQLLKEANAANAAGDAFYDGIVDRLEELQEAASHLTATSAEGAAFQLWLADAETDRTSDADAPAVQRASRKQVKQLHYRAISFFFPGDGCVTEAREYLMSEKLDPARNMFGHRTAELAAALETYEAA